MTKKKNSPFTQRVVVISATLITVLFLAFLILVFGSVEGVEFSPTHFETRAFSVYEIPVLKIQISPIRREPAQQSSTAKFLFAQSYLQKPAGAPVDWHLAELSRSGMGTFEADAHLLTQPLDFDTWHTSTKNGLWEEWSRKNPSLATVLWPTIRQLAIRELYILMPQVFDYALGTDNDIELKKQIDDYLRTSYAELVTEMRNAKRDQLANELLKEALYDYPTDPTLLKLK